MSERAPEPAFELDVLLSRDAVAARVQALAEQIAPSLDESAVAVCLLVGGLWFASDLTRALAELGKPLAFDSLWLSSYGDGQESRGRCEVRAGLQRSVKGRTVLIMDDVFDTGLSLLEAARHLSEAGAARVLTAVFARKPWPEPRALVPEFVAWEAPGRFLLGYGMDYGGLYRGLPHIAAVKGA